MPNYRPKLKIIIIFIFVVLRLFISLSQQAVYDGYDSQYYFNFELINSFRLPIITLIYSILKNYELITIFQSILSSFSWIVLMIIGSKFFEIDKIKYLFLVVIFSMSFSQIVLVRDNHLLSESFTLSSALLVLASFLNLNFKSHKTHIQFLASLILFSGVKSTNSIIGLTIFAIYLLFIIYFNSRKKILVSKKIISAMLVSGVLLSNFAHSTITSDISAQLNTSAIINFRIWGNENWRSYLFNSQYPPELRTIWRDRQNYNVGETPDQGVINEAIFQKWWENGGDNFLINFMIDHLEYTILGPFFLPELNSRSDYSYTLINAWGQDPRVNLELIKIALPTEVIWQEERFSSYLSISIFLFIIGFYFLAFQFGRFRAEFLFICRLAAVTLLMFFWSYFSWWFGSKPPGDILRHHEMPSVVLRLIFVFCILRIVESLLKIRKKNTSSHAGPLG